MTTIEKIKREIQERLSLQSCFKDEFAAGSRDALQGLLSFLDTIEESEKPMNQEGLEKEINRYLEPIHTADIQFEPFTQMTKCARHFAQWGAEHLKK